MLAGIGRTIYNDYTTTSPPLNCANSFENIVKRYKI